MASRAVTEYKTGDFGVSMHYLGRALHYAADLSQPHHAANKTALNSNHTDYEAWAQNNQYSYAVNTMPSSLYTWARNTNIYDMGHNFAANAKMYIDQALNTATYASATSNTLPKAQRNCASVIYKFMIDVGLVS